MKNTHALFALLAAGLLLAAAGGAEIRVTTNEELALALRRARAGDTILVAPGKYRGGLSQAGLAGAKERPIVLAGAMPADPPVFEGGGSGLHFSSPRHLELRDLVISGARGNGLNIDDGGAADSPAQNLVLKNIVVRDVGPTGNRDGIKLSGVVNFRVENCRVERWGSGGSAIDMVGCQNGQIVGCLFREATGDAANGVQAKGGSSEILISRCRFENSGGRGVNAGGSTGLPYFRPRDATYEARRITVEDCEFIGGLSAVAFVGVDGALARHNTIYLPKRWPFRILQENTDARFVPSRKGQIINNVVAFRSDELREAVNIGGGTAPDTFEFSGNAWCCLDRPENTRRLVRLPVAEKEGSYGVPPRFRNAEQKDVRLIGRQPQDAGVREPPGES